MKKIFHLSIILFLLLHVNTSLGQKSNKTKTKNSISFSISSVYVTGLASVDYERCLFKKQKIEILARIGAGSWYYLDHGIFTHHYNGKSIQSGVGFIFGGFSHKFEINSGIRYNFLEDWEKEEINQFRPVLNVGYRYQQPQGRGLLFRIFAGDTGLGISIGKAF